METVLDALKAMGKATAREIAARLKIEPATALNMLREHEDAGEITQTNGFWVQAIKGVKPTPKPAVTPPVQFTVSDLIKLMVLHGPKTADELARLAGIQSKRVAPMLTHHMTKGRILREKVGTKFVYSVKPDAMAPAAETPPPVPAPEKSTAEIIEAIPAFASRPDDLIIPSSRFISSEIRRTKTKLVNLQKLQTAVRELRRHKNLLVGQPHD